ncbi:MAG: FAD-binding and (Fe-S)-binding domain-containing protein [Phycisphaerales bacterium]
MAPPAIIPRLEPDGELDARSAAFLSSLRRRGYRGGLRSDLASRVVAATDNSIYEQLPLGVLQPRNEHDVVAIMRTLGEDRFRSIPIAARGGGTGTDGSALTEGFVIDLARGLDRIVEIDVARRIARVQPGVVLSQLNAALAPLGLQFGPSVSPKDRATLGGMIATDGAGKGSRIHGKTSDRVRSLRVVLPGGDVVELRRREVAEIEAAIASGTVEGRLLAAVRATLADRTVRSAIDERWPDLPRHVTGYALPRAFDPTSGAVDLAQLVCGAEGTLGLVVAAELELALLPRHRRLVLIAYASFDDAVADAEPLGEFAPAAIETMDETVLGLARGDESWRGLDPAVANAATDDGIGAINLVEFEGGDEAAIDAARDRLRNESSPLRRRGVAVEGESVRRGLWEVRERAVGLLGNMPGPRQPIAFVEDCAVPPARLPEFVRGFREILGRRGISSGMYGHVDAGCLHVRPALDLRDEADERMVREIADEVEAMTRSLGGVLWGEHGKGYRSRFSEAVFGQVLLGAMGRIKTAFDPHNQMNPGKIAVPDGVPLAMLSIEASTRGSRDREIDPLLQRRHESTIRCNGNAACQSVDAGRSMCPSSKITRDPRHSPRGRALLMKEWLRRVSDLGWHDDGARAEPSWPERMLRTPRLLLDRALGRRDFSDEVLEAMDGCLSCKACAGSCPVKVSVPEFRSEFLFHHHRRRPRPWRDALIGGLEERLPRLARHARIANTIVSVPPVRSLIERLTGLVDAPRLAESSPSRRLAKMGVDVVSIDALASLPPPASPLAEVILLQDAFTSFLDPEALDAAIALLTRLGVRVRVAEYFPTGKGWHVKGYLGRFEVLARSNLDRLERLARSGRSLVGVDPATTLVHRDELPKALGASPNEVPTVQLLSEFLDRLPDAAFAGVRLAAEPGGSPPIRLFRHCTREAIAPEGLDAWRRVFARSGRDLEAVRVGCCGMGGAWGHERPNAADSRGIFGLSWAAEMPHEEAAWDRVAVEGFSCRSQIERICGRRPPSPAEVLLGRRRNT